MPQKNEFSFSNLKDLAIGIYAATILVSAATFFIVALGPNPTLVQSDDLAQGLFGMQETRDRLVVASWWSIAVLLVAFLYFRHYKKTESSSSRFLGYSFVHSIFGAAAIAVLTVNYLVDLDRRYTDNYPRLNIREIAVGIVVFVFFSYLLADRHRRPNKISVGVLVALTSLVGLYLIQTPGTIKDFGHFSFLGNELLAPSAGLTPISTFVTQYTSILGWPIAPVINIFPGYISLITVSYLLLLQLWCIVAPVVVSTRIAGWRLATPSLLIVALSVFSHAGTGLGSLASYFSGFPIRTALPTVLYVVVVLLADSPRFISRGASIPLLVAGIVGGTAFLNNPDFGGTAWLAGLITLLISPPSISRVRLIMFYVLSSGLPFIIADFLARSAGHEMRWSNFVFFQSLFGKSGYLLETMAVGGLHVAYVSFFIGGILVAVFLSLGSPEDISTSQMRISRMIGFPAIWGLASIPYFAGRSFTTAITGHTFQFSLLLVGLVTWVIRDRSGTKGMLSHWPKHLCATIILVMPFIYTSAMLSRVDGFGSTTKLLENASTEIPEVNELVQSVNHLVSSHLDLNSNNTAQILMMSNFIEAKTGLESALIVSHPEYLINHPRLLEMQCNSLMLLRPKYLLEMNWELSPTDSPICKAKLVSTVLGSSNGYLGVRLIRLRFAD